MIKTRASLLSWGSLHLHIQRGPHKLVPVWSSHGYIFLTGIELLITNFFHRNSLWTNISAEIFYKVYKKKPQQLWPRNGTLQIGFSDTAMPLTTLCTNLYPTMTSAWFKNNHRLHLLSSKKRMLVNVSNNSTISGPNASSLGYYFTGASMEYQVNSVIIRKKLSANFIIAPLIAVTKVKRKNNASSRNDNWQTLSSLKKTNNEMHETCHISTRVKWLLLTQEDQKTMWTEWVKTHCWRQHRIINTP